LGLITQRPSDLAEGVLSQCGTIIAMRLNNDRDQAFVKAAMPEGARGFLDSIPALRNRECIICGEGVAIPIRVSFDNLDEAKRPASEDPSFTELWRESGGEHERVVRTVQRWRAQAKEGGGHSRDDAKRCACASRPWLSDAPAKARRSWLADFPQNSASSPSLAEFRTAGRPGCRTTPR